MRQDKGANDVSGLETQLSEGLARLGLDLEDTKRQQLLAFLALLYKWNRTFNLTAIRSPKQAVTLHLLDSLAVEPYLKGPNIVDVGTGAGLPGIPLAIARPDLEFVLLDSNIKKTRFVSQVVTELGLKNVSVVQSRVEKFVSEQLFSCVISRAYSILADMLNTTRHLCDKEGIFLAMKGRDPDDEKSSLPPGFEVLGSYHLEVPGLDAERHLVVITKEDSIA